MFAPKAIEMNDPNELKIHEALGSLGAQFDHLNKRLDASEQRAREEERHSAESRSRLYEKVEDIARRSHATEILNARMEAQISQQGHDFRSWMKDTETRVGKLEESQRIHHDEIEEMRPKVDLFGKWEQRGIGIGIALTVLGVTFGAALATFRDKLFRLFLG